MTQVLETLRDQLKALSPEDRAFVTGEAKPHNAHVFMLLEPPPHNPQEPYTEHLTFLKHTGWMLTQRPFYSDFLKLQYTRSVLIADGRMTAETNPLHFKWGNYWTELNEQHDLMYGLCLIKWQKFLNRVATEERSAIRRFGNNNYLTFSAGAGDFERLWINQGHGDPPQVFKEIQTKKANAHA